MKNSILKFAGLQALGTVLYVALVATFLSDTPTILAAAPNKSVLIPIAMLLLFVLSASITGMLVLGRPVMWYLDGKKKEAVSLLLMTLGCLFLVTLVAFGALALSTR